MSILQEYNSHKQYIGSKKLRAIDQYLKIHRHLSYDDIIYHQKEWQKFEKWYNNIYGEGAKGDCRV